MTWIDERLFGWSHSAKRGTSAWGGTPADDISRVNTPDDSDDEDTGDYDNVIGVIPPNEDLLNVQKVRSRQSSYADLQKLRMTTVISQQDKAASDRNEGLRHRSGQT